MANARDILAKKVSGFRREPGSFPLGSFSIDWAHPLARELVSFVINGVDIVRGIRGVMTNGSYGADQHGHYWAKDTDARLNFPPPRLDFPDAGYPNMTMVAGGHFQSAEASSVLSITQASGPWGVALRPYQWGASGRCGVTHFNNADVDGGLAIPDSDYHVFGTAFDSVSHTFAADGRQLVEGVAAAAVSVDAGLDTMTWGANEKNASVSDHLPNGDRVHFTAVWNRKLSPMELLSFTGDPQQILRANNDLLAAAFQASVAPSALLLRMISNQGGF